MPFLAITQAFQGRVTVGVAASSKKGYEESSNVSHSLSLYWRYFSHVSQIAYEAIANIRTVASLGLEEKMGNLFEDKIRRPHKYVNSVHACLLPFSILYSSSIGNRCIMLCCLVSCLASRVD